MDIKVFNTKKPDLTFTLLLAIMVIVMFTIAIVSFLDTADITVPIIVGIVCLILILMNISSIFNLKIIIDGQYLIVKNVFILYRADIHNIITIRKGETMWSGFHKYGTATKGLIIFVRQKDDLYITPKDEEAFLAELRKINSSFKFEQV